MAFDDIAGASYNKLIEHTKKVKPYKDSNGAYNLGYRKYTNRHFRVREDGVIDIFFCDMTNAKRKIKDGTLEEETMASALAINESSLIPEFSSTVSDTFA